MSLEQERRRAEAEASRLEAERQAALLAKEELARHAEDQKKSQEQLVSTTGNSAPYLLDVFPPPFYTIFILCPNHKYFIHV